MKRSQAEVSDSWRYGFLYTYSPVLKLWVDRHRSVTIPPGVTLTSLENKFAEEYNRNGQDVMIKVIDR